jgi:dihydropteroate synthase
VQQDTINIRGTLFDLSSPKVMGILNLTSDSFYDGGQFDDLSSAEKQIQVMLAEGADIIDVGGASSRPGAQPVSTQLEQERILPVIELLNEKFPNTIVSVDTNNAETAKVAIAAGAHIVNDISAGDDDADMLSTVGKLKVPFIAMHKQGSPESMQQNPHYNDVVTEVADYFLNKIEACKSMGIVDVIIDPGFGFGKTVQHNYALLKQLPALINLTKTPILVGVSRKSMINKVLKIKASEALNGTTVLHSWALQNGAKLLRVHDVKEAKEAITLFEAYQDA